MPPLAAAPQPLGAILLQGLTLGRSLFRRLFMLTSLWMFLGLIPVIFLVWNARDVPISPEVQLQALGGRYGLALLLCFAAQLFVVTLLLQRIAQGGRGEPEGRPGEWQATLRLWPWLTAAMLIYYAALVLGLILFVVPGVILCISLAFTPFAVVVDGRGPFPALNFSHNLVWGQWWRTLGLFLSLFIPLLLAIMMVANLLGIDVLATQGGDFPNGRTLFEESVLGMVLESFFWPFGLSVMYLYYRDLKLRKQPAT